MGGKYASKITHWCGNFRKCKHSCISFEKHPWIKNKLNKPVKKKLASSKGK